MPETLDLSSKTDAIVFAKETLVKGRPAQIRCVEIQGQTYSIAKGPVTVVSLEDEWYEDVQNPDRVIHELKSCSKIGADLFTFMQRLPDTEPKHHYYLECDSIAALRIRSYEEWWGKQVKGTTRNMIRKSQKAGIQVREASYDDDFVKGMVDIFNESPVRQGRRFWHYGKDHETVKKQFSRFLFREHLIGAYLGNELIGFVMLANAGRFAVLGQIISKVKHRDKATNNALIAKAVEVCARIELQYLAYGYWDDSSLVDFKRHSGFEEFKLPRYFVALSRKGKLALDLGLHHGFKAALPNQIKSPLKRFRRMWNEWRTN